MPEDSRAKEQDQKEKKIFIGKQMYAVYSAVTSERFKEQCHKIFDDIFCLKDLT